MTSRKIGTVGFVYLDVSTPIGNDSEPCTHPSHRGFAGAIGADFVPVAPPNVGFVAGTFVQHLAMGLSFEVKHFDHYVLEYSDLLYVAPIIKRKYPDSTLVCLLTHEIFGMESYAFGDGSRLKSLLRKGDRTVDHFAKRKLLTQYVDGLIGVSELSVEYALSLSPSIDIPYEVAHPFIQPDVYAHLDGISPALNTNSVVHISVGREHKGVDLLVDGWPEIRETHPNAELHIVGPKHPTSYEATPGVTVHGRVDDIGTVLAGASLYVHPARVDGFGVSIVEAMLAGVPPLVTNTTGACSEVRKIDERLVVDPNSDALVEGVLNYFAMDLSSRKRLSKEAETRGKTFDAVSRKQAFRQAFESLASNL